jgi:hypothetical protein
MKNAINLISQVFSVVFLGFLMAALIKAERYELAVACGVVLLVVLKFQHVDKFRISRHGIELEDKDEPKN